MIKEKGVLFLFLFLLIGSGLVVGQFLGTDPLAYLNPAFPQSVGTGTYSPIEPNSNGYFRSYDISEIPTEGLFFKSHDKVFQVGVDENGNYQGRQVGCESPTSCPPFQDIPFNVDTPNAQEHADFFNDEKIDGKVAAADGGCGPGCEDCDEDDPKELQYDDAPADPSEPVAEIEKDKLSDDGEKDKVANPEEGKEIDSDDYACRMNGVMEGSDKGSIDAFVDGFGKMEGDKRDEVWNSGSMKPDTRKKLFEELMKKDGIEFETDGKDMAGEWAGEGEAADFTPKGFKPMGLPEIKKGNAKKGDVKIPKGINVKSEERQKVTDIKMKGDTLSYIFDGGRSVNLEKGGEASFNADTMAVTLKDGIEVPIYGDDAVNVDKNGRLEFGYSLEDGEFKAAKGLFQDRMSGVSMWPASADDVPESAKDFKSLGKGEYKYWEKDGKIYSVDSDGAVREFKSAYIIPGKDGAPARMVGGFTSDPDVGTLFPSQSSEGMVVDWTGKSSGENTFSYSKDDGSLSINSKDRSWFAMGSDLKNLDLGGRAVVQNGESALQNDGNGNIGVRKILNQDDTAFNIDSINDKFIAEKGENGKMIVKTKDGEVVYGGTVPIEKVKNDVINNVQGATPDVPSIKTDTEGGDERTLSLGSLNKGFEGLKTEKDIIDLVGDEGLALVKFGADWCGACGEMDGTINDLATNEPFAVIDINVDKNPVFKNTIGGSIPAYAVVRNGKFEMINVVGSTTYRLLKDAVIRL